MTLVSVGRQVFWPGYTDGGGAAPSSMQSGLTGMTVLDAAGEYHAWPLQASEDMTIKTVDFFCTTATSCVLDVRIEIPNASGVPDGTLWATTTNVNTSSINGTSQFVTATLTSAATITRGQKYLLVIQHVSGTSATLGQLLAGRGPMMQASTQYPYLVSNTSGSAAKTDIEASYPIAIGNATPTFYYIPNFLPIGAVIATATMANNVTIRGVGLRFKLPFKARVIGLRFDDSSINSTDDVTCGIYLAAGTEVQSSATAYNRDDSYLVTAAGVSQVYFDSPVTAEKDTEYVAGVIAGTTGTSVLPYYTLTNVNRMGASPGGAECHLATLDSGGVWTMGTTNVPRIDIIYDQVDVSSGGAHFSVAMSG